MQIPPNMKRRVQPFSFTELSLSDAEVSQLCVIPSRAGPRRTRRAVRMAMAAGLAFLALPACAALTPPALVEATVEAVQLARSAVSVQKKVLVGQGRTVRVSVRPPPVPAVVDGALLVKAERAMTSGQYRAALALYQKLIRRQPAQVDALFGAALASHELDQTKGASVYLARTLALRPDHPLANVLAGFTDQLGKRYGDARERYTRFLGVEQSGERAEEIRAVLAAMPQTGSVTVTGAR